MGLGVMCSGGFNGRRCRQMPQAPCPLVRTGPSYRGKEICETLDLHTESQGAKDVPLRLIKAGPQQQSVMSI